MQLLGAPPVLITGLIVKQLLHARTATRTFSLRVEEDLQGQHLFIPLILALLNKLIGHRTEK